MMFFDRPLNHKNDSILNLLEIDPSQNQVHTIVQLAQVDNKLTAISTCLYKLFADIF